MVVVYLLVLLLLVVYLLEDLRASLPEAERLWVPMEDLEALLRVPVRLLADAVRLSPVVYLDRVADCVPVPVPDIRLLEALEVPAAVIAERRLWVAVPDPVVPLLAETLLRSVEVPRVRV